MDLVLVSLALVHSPLFRYLLYVAIYSAHTAVLLLCFVSSSSIYLHPCELSPPPVRAFKHFARLRSAFPFSFFFIVSSYFFWWRHLNSWSSLVNQTADPFLLRSMPPKKRQGAQSAGQAIGCEFCILSGLSIICEFVLRDYLSPSTSDLRPPTHHSAVLRQKLSLPLTGVINFGKPIS